MPDSNWASITVTYALMLFSSADTGYILGTKSMIPKDSGADWIPTVAACIMGAVTIYVAVRYVAELTGRTVCKALTLSDFWNLGAQKWGLIVVPTMIAFILGSIAGYYPLLGEGKVDEVAIALLILAVSLVVSIKLASVENPEGWSKLFMVLLGCGWIVAGVILLQRKGAIEEEEKKVSDESIQLFTALGSICVAAGGLTVLGTLVWALRNYHGGDSAPAGVPEVSGVPDVSGANSVASAPPVPPRPSREIVAQNLPHNVPPAPPLLSQANPLSR